MTVPGYLPIVSKPREFTNDKAVDFHSILSTLKSKNVDLIFFGGLDEQGAMLVKQMRSWHQRTTVRGGRIEEQCAVRAVCL
jgi:hypothetical protein